MSGKRLRNQQRPLKAGQLVKFGTVEARLELAERPSADTTTEMTAIQAFDRRQGASPKSPPEPSPFAMTLDSGVPNHLEEHALMLPRPPETVKPSPPPACDKSGRTEKPPGKALIVLILGLTVLGLAALAWLIWA